MRFIPYSSDNTFRDSSGLLVYLDTSDIPLPVPESMTDGDGNVVKLDTQEKQLEYFNNVYKPRLLFNATTYDTLRRYDLSAWEVVFGSVNRFMNMLDNESKKQICMTFILMHDILNTMTSSNMITVIDKMAEMLDQLDQQTDLCTKLEQFVEVDMPIPELADVGGRPQDTEQMTFRKPHVLMLTAIALLCKSLAPIYGQFFHQYKQNTTADNNVKEIHCATILKDLLQRRYKQLILKLNHFVVNILSQQYKQKDDIISAYNGNTIQSQALDGISSIFTRKFITVDLYKNDGNLMTYITTCLKNSVDTKYRTASSKNNIREREDNKSMKEASSDEGNASRLENESFTSMKTADVPILVNWIVNFTIDNLRHELGLTDEIYEQALAYYNSNLPPMTPVSNYLLCTYFGHRLGGAIGIAMLPALTYAKLSIVLQFVLIKQGFHGLAHAIMIIPQDRSKSTLTEIDNRVRMTWCNMPAYRNFKQRFPFGVGDRECDVKLKEVLEFLTSRVHTFNTAPVFWEIMGAEVNNGVMYQCTPDIMEQLCNFINGVTSEAFYQ